MLHLGWCITLHTESVTVPRTARCEGFDAECMRVPRVIACQRQLHDWRLWP